MTKVLFNGLGDLLWNTWPEFKTTENDLSIFEMQDYDTMDKEIKNLETLLTRMKVIRKTKLEEEIKTTEEKLNRLKNEK